MSPPWGLDRFGTFPFVTSQYGRHGRVPNGRIPNGVVNGISASEPNTPSAPRSAGFVAPQTESLDSLRCFREACGRLFPDDNSWREHSRTCRVQTSRYQCVFTKCAGNFVQDSLDDFIRHQKMHRIWTCELEQCFFSFGKWEKAVKHAAKAHRLEYPESRIKEIWVATAPKNHKKDFRCPHKDGFDLGNFLELFGPEIFGPPGGAPGPRIHGPGGSRNSEGIVSQGPLASAVFTHIAGQLDMLSSLLDHQSLTPTVSESHRIQQALNMLREKLSTREEWEPVQSGWNGSFSFQASPDPPSIPAQGQVFPGSPATNSQEAPSEITHIQRSTPVSSGISPWQEVDERSLPDIESESEEDSDEEVEHENGKVLPDDKEPQQDAHLEKTEQIKYFEAMQKCCIEAAFTFYQRHKLHLDTINDRSSKPLCITAKKEPINSPTDLSLPHWTHLLRRISDARGLQKEMVSRLESFNGDILPVDEIQHAFKKEKVKSDRDLLALIQLTRNFCWQLKDWDKCKDLDDLYGVLEKTIRQAKRKSSQGSRRQRPRLYSPRTSEKEGIRSPHRQSATWPRLPPDAEDGAYV